MVLKSSNIRGPPAHIKAVNRHHGINGGDAPSPGAAVDTCAGTRSQAAAAAESDSSNGLSGGSNSISRVPADNLRRSVASPLREPLKIGTPLSGQFADDAWL